MMAFSFSSSFPDGVRFSPTDKELTASYLRRRVEGLPVNPGFVLDCDVYHTEPWNLPMDEFKNGKEGELFYFTPRHRVSPSRKNAGCRVRRIAGEGSWEANGQTKPIYDGSPQAIVIGRKSSLVFKCKDKATGAIRKTDWTMHEYLLPSPDDKFQELALCRIRYKGRNEDETRPPTLKKRRIAWESSQLSASSGAHVRDYSNRSRDNASEITTGCIDCPPPAAASSSFNPANYICTSGREAGTSGGTSTWETSRREADTSWRTSTWEGVTNSADEYLSPPPSTTEMSCQSNSVVVEIPARSWQETGPEVLCSSPDDGEIQTDCFEGLEEMFDLPSLSPLHQDV